MFPLDDLYKNVHMEHRVLLQINTTCMQV